MVTRRLTYIQRCNPWPRLPICIKVKIPFGPHWESSGDVHADFARKLAIRLGCVLSEPSILIQEFDQPWSLEVTRLAEVGGVDRWVILDFIVYGFMDNKMQHFFSILSCRHKIGKPFWEILVILPRCSALNTSQHMSDMDLVIQGGHPWIAKFVYNLHYRRKFRSQTSDNMDRWKAEQGRGREKRKIRRKKSRRERVRRKKMQMREKVGKSRNTVFFQWFVAPEGRKVGSLKRRVRSQLARREMKNCTPLWREAHFQVKMYTTHHSRTTFGSWDVEKVHAVVARSTYPSQNVQNTQCSDHFWKLRCRKSARHCGAKDIFKSKCTKHTMFGPLLEVEMSKKCTPLWREAHLEVKMCKTPQCRTTFGSWDVEKVHAVVARSTFRSQNVKNTRGSDHFWGFGCRKSACRCGAKDISKSKCSKH